MSFEIDGDGKVTFTCKGCNKEKTTRSLKGLPKGWLVTGVLRIADDPEMAEVEYHPAEDWEKHQHRLQEAQTQLNARLDKLGSMIGAHFCSKKCYKTILLSEENKTKIEKLGVTLAVYGKCEVVIDGAAGAATKMSEPGEGEVRKGDIPPFEVGGGPGI